MNDTLVLSVFYFNFVKKQNPHVMFKQRLIFDGILSHLKKKQHTIITGARQTGKTTILNQLFKLLNADNKKTVLVSFEKEEILRKINTDPENIFQYISRPKNPLTEGIDTPVFLLIDEIQYAANPSNFLKYLYDTYQPNLKIIATGSSSFYIDKKFKDSLAGRKKLFILKTLNFEEFLIFKEKEQLRKELTQIRTSNEYLSLYYNQLMQLFDEYLRYGGYPDVVLSGSISEKIEVLEEIRNSYIKRDILDSRIENETAFFKLILLLASQTGCLINKNNFSKTLGIDITTVEKYLLVLQKCFHISIIKPFYKNLKKEIIKMPKIYFNDLGLRNLLVNNFAETEIRIDKGQVLENYVFLRLNELYRQEEVRFWRTADQKEVDFLVSDSFEKNIAFEVKFNASGIKTSKYKIFKKTYPEFDFQFIEYKSNNFPDTIPVLKL